MDTDNGVTRSAFRQKGDRVTPSAHWIATSEAVLSFTCSRLACELFLNPFTTSTAGPVRNGFQHSLTPFFRPITTRAAVMFNSLQVLADGATTSTSRPPLVQQLLFWRLGIPQNSLTALIYDFALVATVFIGIASAVAMLGIWWERKLAGHIQGRIGPNRVGPIGLLQSIADGIKLLLKEDLIPAQADSVLFRVAPYLAFTPVFAAFLALPFGPELTFEPRLSVGVFWVLAVLGVEVLAIIIAGWASNNKWSIYGAMRQACQMVSYEIPLGMSILVAVMSAGTLNMVRLGQIQSGGLHTWIIFRNPFTLLAFLVCFVAGLASNKRAPFDLPESESELVAGFHTEYSGLRFSFFFFSEYSAMFVIGAVQAALFLGGWNDPVGLIGWAHARYVGVGADGTYAHPIALLALNVAAAGVFIIKCAHADLRSNVAPLDASPAQDRPGTLCLRQGTPSGRLRPAARGRALAVARN